MDKLPTWARVAIGIISGVPVTIVGLLAVLPVVVVWAFVGGPVYGLKLRALMAEKPPA